MQTNKERNLIVEITFDFAYKIIRFAELLEHDRKFILSRQILRSGTAIGANVREAQNAESRSDFIHKMKVAAKEADETEYWLLLIDKSYNYGDCGELLSAVSSIIKVLLK